MWYEILPSFSIIVVAMAFPHFAGYVYNKALLGNSYRRSVDDLDQRLSYLRDRRLSPDGSPYNTVGLEGIPDN